MTRGVGATSLHEDLDALVGDAQFASEGEEGVWPVGGQSCDFGGVVEPGSLECGLSLGAGCAGCVEAGAVFGGQGLGSVQQRRVLSLSSPS